MILAMPTCMRRSARRTALIVLLAAAIAGAPDLHPLLGCDNDSDAAAAIVHSGQYPKGERDQGHVREHGRLPGGACCTLDIALNCRALSSSRLALPTPALSDILGSPVIVYAYVLDCDSYADRSELIRHPPPTAVPLFVRFVSFLI